MFDLTWEKPEPLVPRRYRLEVDERIAASGDIVRALAPEDVLRAGERLVGEGIEAVAICFINSYVNPSHEMIATRVLRERFPSLRVTASHEVLPEMKEYERTSTTVVNAYLLPVMQQYLERLAERFRSLGITAPLQVVASNGGMMGAPVASRVPVFAVGSGPAGGRDGRRRLGRATGHADLIVFDMGGTTAKASIIEDGEPSQTSPNTNSARASARRAASPRAAATCSRCRRSTSPRSAPAAARSPAIDAGGLLRVGPESAGADPGPACYGRGGDRPDRHRRQRRARLSQPGVARRRLLEARRPSPRAPSRDIDRRAARAVGARGGARHPRRSPTSSMARAIRSVTVERGKDPRDLAMIAFGGGGPLHATDVARILGIRRVIAPVMSGVFSAAGMLSADVEHNFVAPVLKRLDAAEPAWLRDKAATLMDEGRAVLASEGYRSGAVDLQARGRPALHRPILGTDRSSAGRGPGRRSPAAARRAFP